jgi:amino acid transporter
VSEPSSRERLKRNISLVHLVGIEIGQSMPVLAMLGSGHPISGGTCFYAARFFSPVASFTGVWAYLLLVAEDGLLPRGLAAVNRRFGTPHPANSMSYQ